MDNKFIELKRYIESNITKIEHRIAERNEILEQKNNVESLILTLKQNITEISITERELLKNLLKEEKEIDLLIKKILVCYPYFYDDDLCNESQVVQAKLALSQLIEKIIIISQNLDLKIHKFGHKERDLLEITTYQKYLSSFDESGIIKHLEVDELEGFLIFIKNAPLELSREEVLELITEFSKSSIDYIIKKKEAVVSQQLASISRNSREILEEINNNPILESNVVEEQEVIENNVMQDRMLNETERELLHYMENIMLWINETYGITNFNIDFDGFIDGNNFDLKDRIAFYELATTKKEMWTKIYADLKKYLIPNFCKGIENIDSIMQIFTYINNLYAKENVVVEIKLYEFNKEELDLRKKASQIMEKYSAKLKEYQDLDVASKNYINSMYNEIVSNNYDGLDKNSKFSLIDIKLYKKLDKLYENLNELQEILEHEKELRILSNNAEETDELIKMFLDEISDIVLEIETLEKHIEEQRKESLESYDELSSNQTISSNTMNLFVFLDNGNVHRQSFYDEDKEAIERTDKSKLKAMNNAFQVLSSTSFINQSRNNGFVQLSPDHRSKFFSNFVKPFRYSRENIRLFYATIPLTPNNQTMIKEELGLTAPDINMLLIPGFAHVKNDHWFYNTIESRINNQENQIKNLHQIFGNDFTEETKKIAYDLINKGFAYVEDMKKSAERERD